VYDGNERGARQTNNPRKIAVLEELGVVVVERLPCLVQAQEHSLGYLTTKQVLPSWSAQTFQGGDVHP